MINVDLKPLLKGGISRYSLCVAIARLSRDINDDLMKNEKRAENTEKPVSLAVEKILSGEYRIIESDEINDY